MAQPCVGAACVPVVTMCGNRWACAAWLPLGALSVTAGDGLANVAGTIDFLGTCRP